MNTRALLLISLLALMPTLALAELGEVEQRISQSLRTVNPDMRVDAIDTTPVPGLYEVQIGAQIMYFSEDGRYVLQGELVDLETRSSLTEARRAGARLDMLAKLPEEEYLIYPAEGETKHRVVVFTDIDCPYCRRMHAHMADINQRGIELRYVQMPRAGVESRSYEKAVSVYCSDNPLDAMDRAKDGKNVPKKTCENPVRSHLQLARELGINATPTVVFESGVVHPGYMSAADLQARAEAEAK